MEYVVGIGVGFIFLTHPYPRIFATESDSGRTTGDLNEHGRVKHYRPQ